MTRQAVVSLAAAAVLVAWGCSAPEAPAALGTPPPARPAEAPVTVHVQVPDGAGDLAEAWAEELRTAVSGGHGDLRLAASPAEATVVVRIDGVETGEGAASEEEDGGKVSVMHGALVVGGSPREFNLNYHGGARPQAEALARNLRSFASEGGAPTEAPAEDTEDSEPEPEPSS
jgi:hypothetical protein